MIRLLNNHGLQDGTVAVFAFAAAGAADWSNPQTVLAVLGAAIVLVRALIELAKLIKTPGIPASSGFDRRRDGAHNKSAQSPARNKRDGRPPDA
jgi:hypothetical protein